MQSKAIVKEINCKTIVKNGMRESPKITGFRPSDGAPDPHASLSDFFYNQFFAFEASF